MEELTWSPSASYSPSFALVVASIPTLIARLDPASINTKQQRDCNIQMAIWNIEGYTYTYVGKWAAILING